MEKNNFCFLSEIFKELKINWEYIGLIETIFFSFIIQTILYGNLIQLNCYVFLYQIIHTLRDQIISKQPNLIDNQKLNNFWQLRLQYLKLRKRTRDIHQTIVFIFFSTLFVITIAYMLSLSLFEKNRQHLFILFLLYVYYFSGSFLWTCLVISKYTDFEEQFNRDLYEILNELPLKNSFFQLLVLTEAQRQTYLDSLLSHLRFPVTSWGYEINQKMYFSFYNANIALTAILHNIIKQT